MNNRKTLALVLTLVGLILTLSGPFIPGGIHLVPNHPFAAGHVTALMATPKGDILAGTQSGQIWQLRDRIWTQLKLNVGGNPVMAMVGDPGRNPVGTSEGLYFVPPRAPELTGRISSLLQTEQGLVAGTPKGVRWLHDGQWLEPGPKADIYSLFLQKDPDGNWLHAGTIGEGVLSVAAATPGAVWQSNSQGLPKDVNVFSFASARNGALLIGTNRGLYWQPRQGLAWRLLHPDLDGKRILALYLDTRQAAGADARLWIGGDEGLWLMPISVNAEGLMATSEPVPADIREHQPDVGISWILPWGKHLMVSAGQVYQYGPTKLLNWYWLSLSGILLLLVAGWLMPRPQPATSTNRDPS